MWFSDEGATIPKFLKVNLCLLTKYLPYRFGGGSPFSYPSPSIHLLPLLLARLLARISNRTGGRANIGEIFKTMILLGEQFISFF